MPRPTDAGSYNTSLEWQIEQCLTVPIRIATRRGYLRCYLIAFDWTRSWSNERLKQKNLFHGNKNSCVARNKFAFYSDYFCRYFTSDLQSRVKNRCHVFMKLRKRCARGKMIFFIRLDTNFLTESMEFDQIFLDFLSPSNDTITTFIKFCQSLQNFD